MSTVNIAALNAFPDIFSVRPRSEDDEVCIQDIKAVLEKHGKIDRFGLTLLHKHFEIEEGEVLVEETDESTRTQTIQPFKRSEISGTILETAWHLGSNSIGLTCIQTCVSYSDKHRYQHVTMGK